MGGLDLGQILGIEGVVSPGHLHGRELFRDNSNNSKHGKT
jgi:hypothetical protein